MGRTNRGREVAARFGEQFLQFYDDTRPEGGGADNANRSDWAQGALTAFAALTGQAKLVNGMVERTEEPETVLGDLLCDLRHWCDVLSVDFAAAVERSRGMWEEEVAEEQDDESLEDTFADALKEAIESRREQLKRTDDPDDRSSIRITIERYERALRELTREDEEAARRAVAGELARSLEAEGRDDEALAVRADPGRFVKKADEEVGE